MGMIINPYNVVPAGDASFANVAALLHMDGTNGSTTFTDQSGKTWTAVLGAQISTAQSKFGGASGIFDGTNNSVVLDTAHVDFKFTGDFTMEAWVYLNNTTGNQVVMDNRGAGGGEEGWGLYAAASTYSGAWAVYGNAGNVASGTVLSTSTWHHLAISRTGTTLKGFLDGTQDFSVTDSRVASGSTNPVRIGATVGVSQWMNGYIDDLRITKSVGRYTGAFTPPTAAFPNS